MSFKRIIESSEKLSGEALTAALAGIGMNFATSQDLNANIEDTLVAASIEGLENDDLRVLSVLTLWLQEHISIVNADRLIRLVLNIKPARVRAYWCAVGRWFAKDRRFARLRKLYRGPRVDLLTAGTEFQIQRHGEDERFNKTPLRVPANVLRVRDRDVMPPQELAKHHATYFYRVMMGPSYRADMWAELTRHPDLSVSELARRTYGSFATAWQVKKDMALLK
jgi:hypothetical protein